MKIFERKRVWLLAIPLLLVSFGLWRVREARSWLPRATPLYSGQSPSQNITQIPVVWRDNGLWILRADTDNPFVAPTQKVAVNWNRAPIALHFSELNSDMVKVVNANGREVLKITNGELEVWNAGQKRVSQKIELFQPSALAISSDSSRWAVASHLYSATPPRDKSDFSFDGVTLWNSQSKRQISRLYAKLGNVTALEFSPDSTLLAAVAADGYAFIWNANDGNLVRKWRAHPWVAATVVWSPDSQTLVTGANPRLGLAGNWTISLINGLSMGGNGGDISGGSTIGYKEKQLKSKTDSQHNLTINGQTDRSLRLWNVKSGQMIGKWESATGVASAQFAPDGGELAVGTHGEALILDAATLEVKRRLPMKDYPKWPASVAWSPDGKTLAVACAPQLSIWRAH